MHYNLLFNGCSFTAGAELEGKNKDFEYRDKHRYSQVISERTGKTYDNISRSGNSNDRITRETIDWFERDNTCDLAIIQFTCITRIEFISKHEQHPTNFCPGGIKKWDLKWHTKNNEEHKNAQEAHEFYYKHFYNDNIGLYNFYKNLFIIEQYFEKNNIDYIFLKFRRSRFNVFKLDQEKLKMHDGKFNSLDFYWQLGCKNRYSTITPIVGKILDPNDKSNFATNYSDEGYPFLTGLHPSELGHQKIADYILKQLNK